MDAFPNFGENSAWGPSTSEQPQGNILKDAVRKEEVIKEILNAQNDLRALLGRTKTVQGDIEKLTAENATLQMYIDNLTRQIARR
ncbi:hypothetical protein SISNIDRAFT_454751 [Sistotremastrum niveocremeum HHB9708]|uniref:Uncharacterized protein n=1 Tax=Sistotremastrum niveocremeum HHB9708 TaxID=1314777 RepID=A0A164UUE3_9AGAM|nr:hypothetical protein SISNIDRAFT_454751 [Sistotremastrum niveocremeum HHB9708]